MADLPRYRPLGAAIASMPSVNYIQTGSIEAQKYEQIDRSLGRISDYLYEQEVARAKVAGAKYGAEKAPTIEQLSQAREFGRDISGLVPGDDTVFGMAARKSAMSVIESQMEIAARGAITQLRIDAEANEMSADEFQVKLNGLIDGYSTTLSQINPVSARNFEATMAVTANSNLLAHAQDIAEKNEEREKIKVNYTVDTDIIPQIAVEIRAGVTVSDETGEFVTPQDRIDVLRDDVIDLITDNITDASEAKAIIKRFDDAASKARTGAITDWLTSDPLNNMIELQTNNIQNVNIRSVIDAMTDEERRNSVDQSFTVLNRELSLEASLERQNESNRKKQSLALRQDITSEMLDPGSTGQNIDDLMEKLEKIDPESAISFAEKINSSAAANDTNAMIALNKLQSAGEMTHDTLINAFDNDQITWAEYQRRFAILEASKNEDVQMARRLAKNAINPSTSIFAIDDNADAELAQIDTEMLLAMKRDPQLNVFEWMENRLKQRDGAGVSDEEVARAQGIVDAWAKQNGVGNTAKEINQKISEMMRDGDAAKVTRQTKPIQDALAILRKAGQ